MQFTPFSSHPNSQYINSHVVRECVTAGSPKIWAHMYSIGPARQEYDASYWILKRSCSLLTPIKRCANARDGEFHVQTQHMKQKTAYTRGEGYQTFVRRCWSQLTSFIYYISKLKCYNG